MKAGDILDIPSGIWKKIGGRIATGIVKNADKGLDKDGNRFKSYTSGYTKKKSTGKASPKGVSVSRQVSPPNLRLTSVMLNSISAQNPDKYGVDIVFRDGLKIEGNAKRGRDIYGISSDNADQIVKTLSDNVGKNIKKYIRESIEIKIG